MAERRLVVFMDPSTCRPMVECPWCNEMTSPEKNPIFGEHECAECQQLIPPEIMKHYEKADLEWKMDHRPIIQSPIDSGET
jgi:hypothetical protein